MTDIGHSSSNNMINEEKFIENNGIYVPAFRPCHRDEDYPEVWFDQLIRLQRRHFWYRGRHRLLLKILRKEILRLDKTSGLRAIDMGGGCGGWIEYLHAHEQYIFQELALGDSSIRALSLAERIVGSFTKRYQIDLLDLIWSEEWDVVFLLDVLEHISDHEEVLRQIRRSMRPGGMLFVTTPALKYFWSYHDNLSHHQRRYCRKDFYDLGKRVDLELIRTDYFMFFLSPVLLLSRLLFRPSKLSKPDQIQNYIERAYRIPAEPVNDILTKVFFIESLLVNYVRLPWGTSILAVFRR